MLCPPYSTVMSPNSAAFVTTTGVVVSYPASRMAAGSNVRSTCPFFTLSPCAACAVKCSPLSFTVSMPTWMSTSMPSADFRPMACFVSKNTVISPSNGATTLPCGFLTAAPRPIAPVLKTISLTALSGISSPSSGLVSRISLILLPPSCLFRYCRFSQQLLHSTYESPDECGISSTRIS